MTAWQSPDQSNLCPTLLLNLFSFLQTDEWPAKAGREWASQFLTPLTSQQGALEQVA